jgi:hypothetical protein
MIYMWFTGMNYYKLAVEKDRVTFLRGKTIGQNCLGALAQCDQIW